MGIILYLNREILSKIVQFIILVIGPSLGNRILLDKKVSSMSFSSMTIIIKLMATIFLITNLLKETKLNSIKSL